MKTLGRHLIVEFYGCQGPIDDVDELREIGLAAARAIGATVVGELFHRYDPQGVSGTIAIAESHISLHTWPEARYVAVDLFTCGGLDPRPGFELFGDRLAASSCRMEEIIRGLPSEVDEHSPLLPDDVQIIHRVSPVRTLKS